MEPLSAFVLAGGQSSRMGSEKAFIELAGQTLLARALVLARALTPDVKIVGDPKKFRSYGEVVDDLYRNRGPLAGIHAALKTSPSVWNLILGVDLPFLTPAFLEFLVAGAQALDAIVTVPCAGSHFHPLCAVYRKEFWEYAERALSEGNNRIDALFSKVLTRTLTEDELAPHGFAASIFRNLNTPADLEQANREFARLHL